MITCYRFSLYISEYVDGDVTQEIREEIEEHIAFCPECNKTHQAFSRLLTFCHYCCQKEVPDEAHNQLMQALQHVISGEKKPKPKSRKPKRKKR